MKFLSSSVAAFAGVKTSRRNVRLLFRFFLILVGMMVVFSVIFHVIMALEGQKHSWLTGFYWSLTVMSTLGFGDITFHTDLGRLFSMVVLISGMIFLLVLMPFTLIEFFYAPWVESRSKRSLRHAVPDDMAGHVILLHHNTVTMALIGKLTRYGYSYALVLESADECLRLVDLGINAYCGKTSEAETYRNMRLDTAAMVALTGTDFENARLAFTIRALRADVPIISSADSKSASEVIRLSGASKAFQLASLVGEALARRAHGGNSLNHVVARFDELLIAEAIADSPELEGKSIAEANLRDKAGVNVIGIWERGEFSIAQPSAVIKPNTVLLLAGSESQLQRFDELYRRAEANEDLIIVVGASRVGSAVCRTLDGRGANYRVIDLSGEELRPYGMRGVQGDASHFEVLQKAGIIDARTVIITSHDDDMEIYLTIFCRKLRPDLQIICRATQLDTIAELHRAGADIVLSYASMGADILFNYLKRSDMLMVAEGLSIFNVTAPAALHGKTLAQENLRARTGCNVIALRSPAGLETPPDPFRPMGPEDELILISDPESEKRFFELMNADRED